MSATLLGTQFEIGVKRTRVCSRCNGAGAPPQHLHSCPRCGGLGRLTNTSIIADGAARSQEATTCTACKGCGKVPVKGHACPYCEGKGHVQEEKKYPITIAPGTRSGWTKRFAGEGEHLPRSHPGDLLFVVKVSEHENISIGENDELVYVHNISLRQVSSSGPCRDARYFLLRRFGAQFGSRPVSACDRITQVVSFTSSGAVRLQCHADTRRRPSADPQTRRGHSTRKSR